MKRLSFLITVATVIIALSSPIITIGADRAVTIGKLKELTIKVGEVVDVYCDKNEVVNDFMDGSMSSCWVDHAWVMFRNNQSDPNMEYINVSNTDGSLGLSTIVGLKESPKSFTMRMYYSITWMYPGDNTKYVEQSEYLFYVKVVDDGPKDLTAISLPATKKVREGNSITLTPTLTPSNAKTSLTWSSSNDKIATVSQNGKVEGLKAGKTTITVKASNGLSASCDVTVTGQPSGVRISAQSNQVTIGFGIPVKATVVPADAETTLKWEVDNSDIASISSGGYLKAKGEGTVTVKVTTSNNLTDQITIKVVPVSENMDYRNVSSRLQTVQTLVNKFIRRQ